MDEVKIPAERLVSYLGAYMSGFADGNFRAGASRFARRHPNENLVSQFERIAYGKIVDIEPIPLAYLAEFAEEWTLGFRPDTKSWTKMISGITRRVGRIWWGVSSEFWLDFHKPACLYTEVKPLLYQDFKTALGTSQYWTWARIDILFRALKVLAKYLNENYYCKILVDKLDDSHISFHIHYHPFAAMDDEGFYLFWGVLDMFCELLSLPIKSQPKDDAELIEIDEKSSTITRIIIINPYK